MTTPQDRNGNPITEGDIATGYYPNNGGQISGPVEYVDEDTCSIIDEGSADQAAHGFTLDQVEMHSW